MAFRVGADFLGDALGFGIRRGTREAAADAASTLVRRPAVEVLTQTESQAARAGLHAAEDAGSGAADAALQRASTTAERDMLTQSARTEAQAARSVELEAAAAKPQPVTNINSNNYWNTNKAVAATTVGLGTIGAGTFLGYNALVRGDEDVKQIIALPRDFAKAAADAASRTEEKVEQVLGGLARHMPTGSDLSAAIRGAENRAHDITTGLAGPTQTGVTVLVILAGVVAAYEVYRFVR